MENKLGKVIYELRKEKGLTQKQLSKELSISDKAISRWECGTGRPTLEMMYHISRYFNVSYNDLITARISDDEDDKIVEAIIKEFSDFDKKKIRRIKIGFLISAIIILILTIAIIFTNTYNRFKVYKVYSENDVIDKIYGMYVETNVRDTLYIGDIKIKEEIKKSDIVSVDLFYKEKDKEYILQNYSSLNNVYLVVSQSYIEIDNLSDYFDSLYIRINITDDKNNLKTYETKLEFAMDFSNNKVIYEESNVEPLNRKITDYKELDIKDILLENGFEESNNQTLVKRIDGYVINYLVESRIIKINYEKNGFSYRYQYKMENNILEVMIIDENLMLVQHYIYNIEKNDMNSIVGSCNGHKKVMDLFDDKVLYLFE